jgi:hypothetical protein
VVSEDLLLREEVRGLNKQVMSMSMQLQVLLQDIREELRKHNKLQQTIRDEELNERLESD